MFFIALIEFETREGMDIHKTQHINDNLLHIKYVNSNTEIIFSLSLPQKYSIIHQCTHHTRVGYISYYHKLKIIRYLVNYELFYVLLYIMYQTLK